MSNLERGAIHFVGIGGVGMSAIAEIVARRAGVRVTGSDRVASATTQRLADLGVRVTIGHTAAVVAGAELVVLSSAIPADNPERLEAERRGIPVISRARMLASLMKGQRSIAISGSHGKSTTTWMVATLAIEAELDPTVVVGGRLAGLGGGARCGDGDLVVVEADESDGSFLELDPLGAIVTNVDREHLSHFGSFEALREAFVSFAAALPANGLLVVPHDDGLTARLRHAARCPVVTFGFAAGTGEPAAAAADVTARRLSHSPAETLFDLIVRGETVVRVALPVPGIHNVRNALAAAATAHWLGIPAARIASGLARFVPVGRRLELLGEAAGITVVDDYAHHPREIDATLDGARQAYADRRLVVLFQPHRYTRTRELAEEFPRALAGASLCFVTDIYAAGESPVAGVSAEWLVEAARRAGNEHVCYVPSNHIVRIVGSQLEPGDVLLCLGAGNVNQSGRDVLAMLARGVAAEAH
ncbi:MAG: UDP-N-acetylmuramate--L-alanine ligase [Candidatus Schekmanbacteria bacterium]|nr:UDP-N-acetylmuramate--L-alanine ligase [Candidatus Schekmanbacteria bacterium]